MAAELSAASYRMMAAGSKKPKHKELLLAQAAKAFENPLPRKSGSGVVTSVAGLGNRWDYNAGGAALPGMGKKNPGDTSSRGTIPTAPAPGGGGTGRRRGGTSGIGQIAIPSSTSAPGASKFSGGAPTMTKPALHNALIANRSSMKGAKNTFKGSVSASRAQLKSGAITRKQFRAQFRAASKGRQTAVKAARVTVRVARKANK